MCQQGGNMKKNYQEVELEIIGFYSEDIVTASKEYEVDETELIPNPNY